MSPVYFLAVAVGGFVGAPSRYLLDRAVNGRIESDLPWGTFLINVSGSFLLAFLTALAIHHHLSTGGKDLLGTGFCGAYTTFSTFTFETLAMIEDGQLLEAAANVVGSVAAGLAGAVAGFALGFAA